MKLGFRMPHFMSPIRFVFAVTVILFVLGCANPSAIKGRLSRDVVATSEQKSLVAALARFHRDPLRQIGGFLDFAHSARLNLNANPENSMAQSDYNFAVGRIIEIIRHEDLAPWEVTLRCPSATGEPWRFSLKLPEPRSEFHPAEFQFLPADLDKFRGKFVGEREAKQGLGAPAVVIGKDKGFAKVDPFNKGEEIYYGFTAVVRFSGRNATMILLDPLDTEWVDFDGNPYPLARDSSAPLSLSLAVLNLEKQELSGVFKRNHSKTNARLARLQPYDPDKIPVLCIHGLGNSAATWAPVIDFLHADPEIRKTYQFWFFSYPTGLPYPISAALLRQKLDQIRERYPDHKDMVAIGHSMGGMIGRILIADSGMKIWDAFYDRPPEQIPFSEDTRAVMARSLIFKARSDIDRMIFVSASHRGSDRATNFFGRLGARLVGTPIAERQIHEEAIAFVRPEVRNGRGRLPNSIDILDPENRFVQLVETLPMSAEVPYHSLIGDRGRGGNLDRTRPVSSDGIVPYWSSHLNGAETERIIPSGHWSHRHPAGMAEIKRILLQHASRR